MCRSFHRAALPEAEKSLKLHFSIIYFTTIVMKARNYTRWHRWWRCCGLTWWRKPENSGETTLSELVYVVLHKDNQYMYIVYDHSTLQKCIHTSLVRTERAIKNDHRNVLFFFNLRTVFVYIASPYQLVLSLPAIVSRSDKKERCKMNSIPQQSQHEALKFCHLLSLNVCIAKQVLTKCGTQ